MTPFDYSDYKAYLTESIEVDLGRGAKAKLADAAGCQRSFLSQVLNGPTHLTPEHGLGISLFLNHTEDEREYFLALLGKARSANRTLTDYYEKKMKQLKQKVANLTARLKTTRPEEDLAEYYSSWTYAAIHLLCTIPQFQSVAAISKKLKLNFHEVERRMKRLQHMKLVDLKEGHWVSTRHEIHLPKEHFMTQTNHKNWREKNLELSQLNPELHISYTAVYTMSQKDFGKLKELCFRFLEEGRDIVAPSKEEELVSFSLDCILH